jgi:hypothetical protein
VLPQVFAAAMVEAFGCLLLKAHMILDDSLAFTLLFALGVPLDPLHFKSQKKIGPRVQWNLTTYQSSGIIIETDVLSALKQGNGLPIHKLP